MIQKMLFCCCFLFLCQSSFALTPELDSLKTIVKEMPEDSLKCETLLKIAYILYSGEESEVYAQQALKLAKDLNNPQLRGKSYHRLAWCHGYDEVDKKTAYLDSAAIEFSALNDVNGLGKVFDTKGSILMEYGSLMDAQIAYKRAFDYYVVAKNKERQAGILNNWAISEYMMGNPQEALVKYNQALDFRLSEVPESPVALARLYQGMGESSRLLGNFNLAADYYLEGYKYRAKVNNIGITESLISISSLIYEAAERGKDTIGIINKISTYGFPNSLALLDSAEQVKGVSDRIGIKYLIIDVRRKWSLLHGNYLDAYNLLLELKTIDEAYKLSESSLEALADMKVKYEKDRLKIRLLEEEISNKKSENQVNLLLFSLGIMLSAFVIGWQYHQNRLKATKLQLPEAKQEQQIVAMRSMLDGQERERSRIARDLHDGLGNLLSTLKVNIGSLQINFDDIHSQKIYGSASEMIDEACTEVRKIAHEMMPQALKKLGLRRALEDLIFRIDGTHDFEAQFHVHGRERSLDDNTNVMLFRITQELLNNVIKYAAANEILVQLTYSEDWLNLTVEDDGKGFDYAKIDPDKGMGLKSIAFRTEYIRGNYEIDSRPGAGTLVSINVPLNSQES